MSTPTFSDKLWTARSPEETQALYADWAARYDADVTDAGYETPARLAAALADASTDLTAPILDFGCGTGLSGIALTKAGFTTIDGTDITPEMLEKAAALKLYRETWLGAPGDAPPGGYAAIAAIGVVSLGAAPPEALGMLLDTLAPGGLLGFSFNDATLADQRFLDARDAALTKADLISEAYGPHLSAKDMGSTVTVIRKH